MRFLGCLAFVLFVGAMGCGGGGGAKGLDAQAPDGGTPADGSFDGIHAGGYQLPKPAPPGVTYQGRVVVSPAALTFTAAGDSAVLSATAFDAAGAKVSGPVTWTSSRPGEMSVNADGKVTSVAALGSAQITAKVGDRVSDPILVIVVEPQPDSVFVSDAQIVAGPEPVDAAAPMEPGGQTRVTVTGVPALAVGQLLLAREGKPVAGRVVSIDDTAAGRAVVLQRVPALDLFKKMKIDAHHKVDEHALVEQEAMAAVPQPNAPTQKFELRQGALKIGPFECEADGDVSDFGIMPSVRVVPNVDFGYVLTKDMNDDWSVVSVQITGSVTATGSATIAIMPGFTAGVSCRGVLGRLPLPIGGPLAAVLSFSVPLGLKGKIEATVTTMPFLAGLEVTSTGTVNIGFTYTPQTGVQEMRDATVDFGMKPKLEGPDSKQPFEVQLAANFGPFAGLDVGITFLTIFGGGRASLLEAAFLAKLDSTFSTVVSQLSSPTYASKYEIKPEIVVGPGKDVAKALMFLGGRITLRPELKTDLEDPHATSPKGTMTASTPTAAPGELVELEVKIDAPTLKFMGEDNLEHVIIYRQKPGGGDPEMVKDFATRLGETSFKWKWTPSIEDEGMSSFFAVTTTYFAWELPLEIAPESKVDVLVARKMNVWSGMVTMNIQAMDTKMDTSPGHSVTTNITETTNISLNLETEPGPIPEVPGPFKITGGMVALSSSEMSVDMGTNPIDIGPCRYPRTVSTSTFTTMGGELVPDNYSGMLLVIDAQTGLYGLILGTPEIIATVTTETAQLSQGGGPSCPDQGPPNGHTTTMETVSVRSSQLTYMGMFDPTSPNQISGHEEVMLADYPKTTRTTSWSFHRQ